MSFLRAKAVGLLLTAFLWVIALAMPAAAADLDGFAGLVSKGQTALQRVQTFESAGRKHVPSDQKVTYAELPPTSGPHFETWIKAGFYHAPQTRERLVHSLEHGNVVIYYGMLKPEAEALLKEWAGAYSGQWDGVVVAPLAGVVRGIVLTAWQKKLVLGTFDPAATAAFIDAYRGRGPEHPLR